MTTPAILDFEPDYAAPLPRIFPTGHPIHAEKGIFTVYGWDYVGHKWYGVMSSNVRESAEAFADELTGAAVRRGYRACYRVEDGK